MADNKLARKEVIDAKDHVWNCSVQQIRELLDKIHPSLAPDNQARLNDSFNVLRGIGESLSDPAYARAEDHLFFTEVTLKVPNVYKYLLRSYMNEYSITITRKRRNGSTESIELVDATVEELCKAFYEDLRRRYRTRRVRLIYPAIGVAIQFLRNHEEHADNPTKPIDHITGERSFGSMYILSSIFVLTVYAYIEILRHWVEIQEIIQAGSTSV